MGRKTGIIILVAVLVIASSASAVYVLMGTGEERHPNPISMEVSDRDDFGNCILDCKSDLFFDNGYRYWDYVNVVWGNDDESRELSARAIISHNYSKTATLEYFFNIVDSGTVTFICQFVYGGIEVGDHVSVTYLEESHRDELLPSYEYRRTGVTWDTDEQFVNLRCVDTTGMGDGILYRSSNTFPVDTDEHAPVMDRLIGEYGFRSIVDMNESQHSLESKIETGKITGPNALALLDEGNVFVAYMGTKFVEDPSYEGVFRHILNSEGPIDVNCTHGKDRTGFVIFVLEAFMGATYDEMVEDYMESYVNLFGVVRGSDEYNLLFDMNFKPMAAVFHDYSLLEHPGSYRAEDYDYEHLDYKADAERYLRGLGLSEDEILGLRAKLTA